MYKDGVNPLNYKYATDLMHLSHVVIEGRGVPGMNVENTRIKGWLEKHRLFRAEAVQETSLLYKEAVQGRRVRRSSLKWNRFFTRVSDVRSQGS